MSKSTQPLLHQDLSVHDLCRLIAAHLIKRNWMLATAESCTGGLIAAACTDLPGASSWFERGFVSYSNAAKTELLGVDAALIEQHGAVSEAVVRAMAEGTLRHAHAQVALAVTGVAGPDGGNTDKPVGTVWLCWASPAGLLSIRRHFVGDRATVRNATVHQALAHLLQLLTSENGPLRLLHGRA